MKKIILVEWIEVEYGWGDRPEGYKCFETFDEAFEQTKFDSLKGNYTSGEGYCGPVRPFEFYQAEIDLSKLERNEFPFFITNKQARDLKLKPNSLSPEAKL